MIPLFVALPSVTVLGTPATAASIITAMADPLMIDGDFDATFLLEYAPNAGPPYLLAGLGLAMAVLCGLTFSKQVQLKLEAWKQDRLPLLPLASVESVLPWIGLQIGVTLFIGGSLQVFGFAAGAALLVAAILSLLTAGALWVQLARLMAQVQAGTFKAVDFDNFDEFF